MRTVVVGASGNVGTALLEALAADSRVSSILGVSRRRPSWEPPKTTWATADVGHDDLTELFRGADAVVHLAWLFQPGHDPVRTWQANAVGSTRVFDAVVRAGVPALVHASSVGAYSPGRDDTPVDESWPTDGWPEAAYTREKAYVERVLDGVEARHPDLRVVRLRPAFIFRRESASQQRRLFAGPLLPNRLVRPGSVPIVPLVPGLRFQAVHTADAAAAYRLAILGDARGAFNIAADPVIDPRRLAELLHARTATVPPWLARRALAAAWYLRLVPATPHLFDAVLRLPLLDTTRARTELGWEPEHDGVEALTELLDGLREGAGMSTPPLEPHTGGRLRQREFQTGVGSR